MIAQIVIAALLIVGLIALVATWLPSRSSREAERVIQIDNQCCGQHATCEKDSLLAAVSKDIEYYEDEELDRFQNRTSKEYSDAEADEFREILYSMKSIEVAGWVRSLQLRDIQLPDTIKDEVLLIVGERRMELHTPLDLPQH